MPVLAIAGNKGGAGKTTLSINLATAFNRNASTALIDADPQGSSLQWRMIAPDDTAIPVFGAQRDLRRQIKKLQSEYDNILIDCPPSVHAPQTGTVLKLSNIVLVPVQPSPMDLWATTHIEKAVADALRVNPSLKPMLVINQMELRTTLSRLVRDALEQVAVPVADIAIRRRAAYRHSILHGKSVFDMGSPGRAATAELEQLIQEIKAL